MRPTTRWRFSLTSQEQFIIPTPSSGFQRGGASTCHLGLKGWYRAANLRGACSPTSVLGFRTQPVITISFTRFVCFSASLIQITAPFTENKNSLKTTAFPLAVVVTSERNELWRVALCTRLVGQHTDRHGDFQSRPKALRDPPWA